MIHSGHLIKLRYKNSNFDDLKFIWKPAKYDAKDNTYTCWFIAVQLNIKVKLLEKSAQIVLVKFRSITNFQISFEKISVADDDSATSRPMLHRVDPLLKHPHIQHTAAMHTVGWQSNLVINISLKPDTNQTVHCNVTNAVTIFNDKTRFQFLWKKLMFCYWFKKVFCSVVLKYKHTK